MECHKKAFALCCLNRRWNASCILVPESELDCVMDIGRSLNRIVIVSVKTSDHCTPFRWMEEKADMNVVGG